MDALVVFHGHGKGPWARLLGAPGYRHCFVCIRRGGYWVRLDGQDGTPLIETVCAGTFDLAEFYARQGLKVVATNVQPGPNCWPVMLATCVGAVKRALGIRAPWIITPRQLHRHLIKEK